uniref:CXC domain-containing protein n=1 Tax=Heterosigma akashiwo TaxID=2829 RepID=A0A7S3Y8Y3_HETAK
MAFDGVEACCPCSKRSKCLPNACPCASTGSSCVSCLPFGAEKCENLHFDDCGPSRPMDKIIDEAEDSGDGSQESDSTFDSDAFVKEKMQKAFGAEMVNEEEPIDDEWIPRHEFIASLKSEQYRPSLGSVGQRLVNMQAELVEQLAQGKIKSEKLMCFTPLILQRDKNVKRSRDVRNLIRSRLDMWERGEYDELVAAVKRCDSKFKRRPPLSRKERLLRRFHRLMAERKYREANREVTDRSESSGVLDPNEEAMGKGGPLGKTNIEVFEEKHPKPRTPVKEAFLDQPLPVKEEVVITAEVIERVAHAVKGSAGVSGTDSVAWKSLLLGYGNASGRRGRRLRAWPRRCQTRS